MTTPWALIQHVAIEGPGLVASEAASCGIPLDVRRMFAGDPLPRAEEIGGLIVLGGPMGANDDADFPNLPRERELLAEAAGAGLPVLGICLGAQLLAAALGARVTRGVEEEVGFGEVTLTDEGSRGVTKLPQPGVPLRRPRLRIPVPRGGRSRPPRRVDTDPAGGHIDRPLAPCRGGAGGPEGARVFLPDKKPAPRSWSGACARCQCVRTELERGAESPCFSYLLEMEP